MAEFVKEVERDAFVSVGFVDEIAELEGKTIEKCVAYSDVVLIPATDGQAIAIFDTAIAFSRRGGR